ncbi:hypothetical protein H6F76_26875 [Leptolyngbya sp. FACHB-321]|uniref:hypothetical protein n=1 Tax=Leptolyngbya sp. FACHB-321 TaxID=2692807 RepID=UPI001689E3E2|nr:hypothetical protein [Leptolyngbya sp. FACHB-321]MBD2038582.1 hypothetical protein [Leptolyngbya sp. FACHB-321]
MPPINILVLVHGMVPDEQPRDPLITPEPPQGILGKLFDDRKIVIYEEFWNKLTAKQPKLASLFENFTQTASDGKEYTFPFIGVEWLHELPAAPEPSVDELYDDQRLTRAQNFVNKQIAHEVLRKVPDENNYVLKLLGSRYGGITYDAPTLLILRNIVVGLRETIVTRGLGDVIYYASADGEERVRKRVYHQVLSQLHPYLDEPDVRLHLWGQSLGVTLTHDFLFGLFNRDPDYRPGFLDQAATKTDKTDFERWREKAKKGELRLGSLTSTASQLPILLMRSQKVVDTFANEKLLDATDIGITDPNRVCWNIFYDVDDLLGFGTRRLYNHARAIQEFQVDTGDNPGDAHTNYWKNSVVQEETAQLLYTNALMP